MHIKRTGFGPWRPPMPCPVCGQWFAPETRSVLHGFGRFCSRRCSGISQRRRVAVSCLVCGTAFDVKQHQAAAPSEGKFCSRACYWASLRTRRASLADRVWAKVLKTDGCWLWQGAKSPLGYGRVNSGGRGRSLLAHKVVWELVNGPVPSGLEVCHNCPGGDNPACVRPDHMFLGTHAENMADYAAKRGPRRGERSNLAKLTAASVTAIRRALEEGAGRAALAARYGVSPATIGAIARRDAWKHVA